MCPSRVNFTMRKLKFKKSKKYIKKNIQKNWQYKKPFSQTLLVSFDKKKYIC